MQYVHCNPFENMPSLSPLIVLEEDETPFMEREISSYNSQLYSEESYLERIAPRVGHCRTFSSFDKLVEYYDETTPTKRSYNYSNRSAEEVFLQAVAFNYNDVVVFGLNKIEELRTKTVLNKAAVKTCINGNNIPMLNVLLDLGADNFEEMFKFAVLNNRINIVRRLCKRAKITPTTIYNAASGATEITGVPEYNRGILKLILDNSTDKFAIVIAMIRAGKLNNINVIETLKKHGAKSGDALVGAACGGHMELIHKLGFENSKVYYPRALFSASQAGQLEAVEYFISTGIDVDNINKSFCGACAKGHVKVAKFLYENGATNIQEAIVEATKNKKRATVKYLLSLSV